MRVVALLAVAAAALTAGSAGGAPGPLTFGTRGVIERIAADGQRVALATDKIKGSCDRIVVWNVAAKSFVAYKAGTNCSGDETSLPQYVKEVALAGTRAAWVERTGGNREELILMVGLPGKAKPAYADYQENGNGASGLPQGDYLGNVHADGDLLAYNTWHVCNLLPPGFEDDLAEPCTGTQPPVTEPRYGLDKQKLLRLDGTKSKAVKAGADTYAVVAVDAGRIAAQAASGKVTLFTDAGAVLKKIAVPAGTFAGTALQGNQLVTLRNGSIEVYDTGTGALAKTIPLPAGKAVLRDVDGGLAVYVKGLEVHVVRLSDGKDVLVTVPGSAPVDAQIEPQGLYYSYTTPKSTAKGRVAFLPLAELKKKL